VFVSVAEERAGASFAFAVHAANAAAAFQHPYAFAVPDQEDTPNGRPSHT
jgi:hypothetical protein